MKQLNFTQEEVMRIAKIARLRFSKTEMESITKDMNSLSEWYDQLERSEQDMERVIGVQNLNKYLDLREDEVLRDTKLTDLQKSAVVSEEEFLIVPPVHGRVK